MDVDTGDLIDLLGKSVSERGPEISSPPPVPPRPKPPSRSSSVGPTVERRDKSAALSLPPPLRRESSVVGVLGFNSGTKDWEFQSDKIL